ncbi:MAG: damage-inducible protein CinA, partial [Muribaculaceae bacterium]|nr:damage-inducible protein CinA [Muribaculaceae bacterium]
MNLAIIVIGDELLLGQVADTNSGFIARNIAPFGWTISGITTVSDNADAIYNAIDSAFQNADAVITTGGLGPTKDDITKAVLCRYFCCHTRFDCDVEKNIQRVFDKRGLQMNELTRNQAIVPDKCKVIQNRYGT